MPDGWTTLGELRPGALFETRDGAHGFKIGPVIRSDRHTYQVATPFGQMPWPGEAQVREIDLPFLLMCVQDKLADSDAYQRGLREGREQMRERAAAICHELRAVTIRALPLEG